MPEIVELEPVLIADLSAEERDLINTERRRDIFQALRPAVRRILPLFDTDPAMAATHRWLADQALAQTAAIWSDILGDPMSEQAGLVGRQFITAAYDDHPPHEFWATSLGQLIFARDGFPRRPATNMEAASCLGISRQAVQKSAYFQWKRTPRGLISRERLYIYWRHKANVTKGWQRNNLVATLAEETPWPRPAPLKAAPKKRHTAIDVEDLPLYDGSIRTGSRKLKGATYDGRTDRDFGWATGAAAYRRDDYPPGWDELGEPEDPGDLA